MSLLASFLNEISTSLRTKSGTRIAELIHLDVQSLPSQKQQLYVQLNQELNDQFPAGNDSSLLDRCKQALGQDEFGSFSTAFSECIARYFRYLRDITRVDNLTKATEIRGLTRYVIVTLLQT